MLTRKETLETLKNAASIRKQEVLKKLTEGESDEVPSLLYHRKYYQYFKLKRSRENIENDNKRKSEILNTKLQEIDNFDSQEDDIRPKRAVTCLEFRAVQSIKTAATKIMIFKCSD